VSVWSPPDDGPFIGVRATGELFWTDPASGTLVDVGMLPAGPRRVRCLEPAGTPCAVSSYVAGAITIVDWPDRAAPPVIGASVPVDGPVGIDLAMVGGAVTVASTGFRDGTLHLTTLGAPPSDQATTLPDCPSPGHVIFLPGATHVLVTCNGAAAFEVRAL
jgi:hypothetical protein